MLKPNSTLTNNLIRARELIADEKSWACGATFTRERGLCALQAIAAAQGHMFMYQDFDELEPLSRAAKEILGRRDGLADADEYIYTVNDDLGHAATMAMFDRAIELSLQEPGA